MVKYLCGICNISYSNLEDAEICEKRGFVGTIFEPGILFSHEKVKAGFLVIYNTFEKEAHERKYILEEIRTTDSLTYGLGLVQINNSMLHKWTDVFKVATNEEVSKLNKIITEEKLGTKSIKNSLNHFNIKELHNRLNITWIFSCR